MADGYPFNRFCRDLFSAGGTKAVTPWAERIGCREPDMINWCLGAGTPTDAELVAIHFAVTDPGVAGAAYARRWEEMLDLPLVHAMRVPRLLQIEGEPDPNDPGMPMRDVIENAIWNDLARAMSGLHPKHRLPFLRRCAEHARIIAHYHTHS